MEINKYLNSIDINFDDEEQAKLFISQRGMNIRSYIEFQWADFNSNTLTEEDKSAVQKAEVETLFDPNDTLTHVPHSEMIIIDNEKDPEVDKMLVNAVLEERQEEGSMSSNEELIPFEIDRSNEITIANSGEEANKVKEQNLVLEQSNKSDEAFNIQIKNKTIIIPNAKVNQEYYFLFNIEVFGLYEIGKYWFEGLGVLGLEYNAETKIISGIPQVPGDHKIKLLLRRNDWTEGKPDIEREFTLIVNPDPRSLFRNISTPESIEYYKPDFDKKYIKAAVPGAFSFPTKTPKKNIVLASQRGRSHAHEGIARDDDFGAEYCKKNGWYILTVADGAGSKKYSRRGSEIACNTVVDECKKILELKHKKIESNIEEFNKHNSAENRKILGDSIYHTIVDSFFTALKNIDKEAKIAERHIDDYSTTLIIAICKEFKFGWFIGAFWVGDGGIGIYNKENQSVKILGEPDGGEFAGQTRFITMPEIRDATELYRRLRFEIIKDFTALVLMTDGVTDPKFETDDNLNKIEKWNELWEDLSKEVLLKGDNTQTAEQLLKWLDFWSRGNHDDRTIAILY
jgi:serine/threonine protein phosphatase PrpC